MPDPVARTYANTPNPWRRCVRRGRRWWEWAVQLVKDCGMAVYILVMIILYRVFGWEPE